MNISTFNGQQVRIKKEGGLFDVTMGVFDGAEVFEAVGNFLLYQFSKNCDKKRYWFIQGRWISNI